jgi:hypothetical protein
MIVVDHADETIGGGTFLMALLILNRFYAKAGKTHTVEFHPKMIDFNPEWPNFVKISQKSMNFVRKFVPKFNCAGSGQICWNTNGYRLCIFYLILGN